MSACRECERERARIYNHEHAEARAAIAAEYYEAHRMDFVWRVPQTTTRELSQTSSSAAPRRSTAPSPHGRTQRPSGRLGRQGGLVKTCNLCQQTKPLEEFHRDKEKRDGRRTICKECDRARFAKWYAENREHALAQDDKWHAAKPTYRTLYYFRKKCERHDAPLAELRGYGLTPARRAAS